MGSLPELMPVEICDWPGCDREALYSDEVDGSAQWWCHVHHTVRRVKGVE